MLYTGVWIDIRIFQINLRNQRLKCLIFLKHFFPSVHNFFFTNFLPLTTELQCMHKVIQFGEILIFLNSDESSVKNLKLPAGFELSSREVNITVQIIDYLGEMQEWTKTVTASFFTSFM